MNLTQIIIEILNKIKIKINFFKAYTKEKLEKTLFYSKILVTIDDSYEPKWIWLEKDNEALKSFYRYKNSMFLKDINKIKLFFKNLLNTISTLYIKNLSFFKSIKKKVENTLFYKKILVIKRDYREAEWSLKNNELVVLFYNYKNNLFLKDVDKVKLFFKNLLNIINTLYIKNLSFFEALYFVYLKEKVEFIKGKINILIEKYCILEKKFSDYIERGQVMEDDYILKQNKSIDYGSLVTVLGSRQKNKIYPANPSLWPVFLSIFAGIIVLLFVCILHNQNFIIYLNKQVVTAIFGGAICISFWITTFYKEKQLGFHTYEVRRNIRLGFYIFIFTEAICFLSLFWTFLHALLAASLNIGLHNPGEGIVHFWMTETRLFHPYWERFYYLENQKALLVNLTDYSLYRNKKVFDKNLVIKAHINLHDKGQLINPYKFPLMNTFILLTSACSLNASHTQIKMGKYLTALIWLSFTILLGLSFVLIQYREIKDCTIQFTDGIYGSCFYSLTGLHGTHVILGIFALFICFLNFLKHNYSQKRHDTYWFAILYWHFVDIIWILVYLIIYIWPSFFFHRTGIRWVQLDSNSYCFNFSQEAFENTLYHKLYRDRMKLNHSIVNYAAFKLDKQNLLVNNEYMIFNIETKEEINSKEIKKNIKFFYTEKNFKKKYNRFDLPLYMYHKPDSSIKMDLKEENKLDFLRRKAVAKKFLGRILDGKNVGVWDLPSGHEYKHDSNLKVSSNDSHLNALPLYMHHKHDSSIKMDLKQENKLGFFGRMLKIKKTDPLDHLLYTQEHTHNKEVYLKKKPVKILAKNFKILNKLENKSKILDASNLLYDLIPYFNYNAIKKKNAEHAIALNIIHFGIFNEIQTQEAYDVLNKKYKIFMYFILSCIDRKLCFIWCKYFTPYYLQN